jgi:protein ImuB
MSLDESRGRLWVGLHLPEFPLEVFARASRSAAPLAICEGNGRARQVVCASAAARRLGVLPGLSASAALVLGDALRLRSRDLPAERAALEALAAWAGQFSSLVHIVTPQALVIEVGGSLRLFGGLEALLAALELGLAELGYRARLAVAPTPLAATWLARAGIEEPVTEPSRLAAVLAELPLTVLALAPGEREGFEAMGIRRVGEVLRLPRDGVAKRWGAELLAQLDRALGRLPDPRAAFVPPASFESQLLMPGTVENVEALLFALQRLVTELCGALRARVAGVAGLELLLLHPGTEATRVGFGLVAPSRDARHLLELFREQLARVTLPAPVEALRLRAPKLAALAAASLDLFGSRQADNETATVLVERLRARLGRNAVRGVRGVAEHRPERAYAWSEPGEGGAVADSAERPCWLLPKPLPLETRDGQPWFGGTLELEDNVERIESGWWDGADIARDYFVARNGQGERYWVYRDLPQARQWWLHGVFG